MLPPHGRNVLIALAVILALLVGVMLHDFLEGEHLLADCIDEWRLRGQDLAALDSRWQMSTAKSDVVVTLTTTPSRMPLLGLTLKSLLRQTSLPKRIVINIPHFSLRENCGYLIPQWLTKLASVEIHRCEDLGPATKLLPSLLRFPAEAALLVVDDDRVYHGSMIARIVQASALYPVGALGFSGWIVPSDLIDKPTTLISNILMQPPAPVRAPRLREPRQVDVLQGMSGYLVRPSHFCLPDVADYSVSPPAARFVDDVWLSGHCLVPRLVIPARHTNYQSKRQRHFYKRTSLGLLNRGPGGNGNRNNSIVIRHLSQKWLTTKGKLTEPASP